MQRLIEPTGASASLRPWHRVYTQPENPSRPIPSRSPKTCPDFPQSPYDPRSFWRVRPGGGGGASDLEGVKELPTWIHGDMWARQDEGGELGTGACRQVGQDALLESMDPTRANTARGKARGVTIRWSHRRDVPVEKTSCPFARQNPERHRCGHGARQSTETASKHHSPRGRRSGAEVLNGGPRRAAAVSITAHYRWI